MNVKRIIFSGLVTALIGTGLGLVLAHIFPTPYRALYPDMKRKYMVIGAVAGLLFGSGQEAVRQLKQESDRQDPE
jgi:hypothetical protein